MPIARSVVHASDRRPEFPSTQPVGRIGCLGPRVRTVPFIRRHNSRRMRCVLQHVVLSIRNAQLYFTYLLADSDHRITESIEFIFRLALCGLHHQGSGDRETDRGSVEAIIDQPFRHILHLHSAGPFQWTQVEYALVGDGPVLSLIEDWVMRLQPTGDVVGIEDCHFRGTCQTGAAQKEDVDPGYRKNARRSVRRRRDGPYPLIATHDNQRMGRKKRNEVLSNSDRSHAGSAPAMGNAECLVEVQVADIGADLAWTRQPDLGIHVRTVHIDLSAMLVNRTTDIPNRLFEYTVRAWVRHH